MIVVSVLSVFVCILFWAWLNPVILIYTHFITPLPGLSFVNNSFTIVQFADLHFGESDEKDSDSLTGMRKILAAEGRTDFVVFTGDQVSGDMISGIHQLRKKWLESLHVVGELNVPFLTLFGNHDDRPYGFNPSEAYQWAGYLTICLSLLLLMCTVAMFYIKGVVKYVAYLVLSLAIAIAIYFITSPSCRIRGYLHQSEANAYPTLSYSSSVDIKTYNFFLPILSSGVPVFNILALDSGGGRIPYDVSGSYIDWIRQSSASTRSKDFIAFFHVPTSEFKDVYLHGDCFGELSTEPNNENLNHILHSLKKSKIRAAFVGHDHGNDWCCRAGGEWPSLCYGRHTGFGGYGMWQRGARVIQLELGANGHVRIETWLRMVDGSERSRGFI